MKRWVIGLALLGACDPPHRMSPWGATGPKLGLYVERPDLERHLADLDREAQNGGLRTVLQRSLEDRAKERYELRVLEGRDRLGRATLAIRVATRHGVVLAEGPPDERALAPPVELVTSLPDGAGGVTPLLGDLTGDGTVDLLTRSTTGVTRMTSLNPRGSTTTSLPFARVIHATREGDAVVLSASVGCVANEADLRVERAPCAGRGAELVRRLYPVAGSFGIDEAREVPWHLARAAALAGDADAAAGSLRARLCLEREFHLRVAKVAVEPSPGCGPAEAAVAGARAALDGLLVPTTE
jgi:hypothetical protein